MNALFHELSTEERKEALSQRMTWGEFCERYSQPSWCHYPDALMGVMGCWGLVVLETPLDGLGRAYCLECECYDEATP